MNDRSFAHLASFAVEHPWAITRPMLGVVAGILAERIAGQRRADETIAAATATRSSRTAARSPAPSAVAVIPIHGVIAPRMNLLSDISGGTTFEALTVALHAAVADPDVKAIVFDVDSPGGSVAGATEFAAEVRQAARVKPVIAQAEHLMASAAYWVGACATEVVASPSAMVGSIGVFTIHDDLSAALEQLGVKRDVISAGRYKADGAANGPLSKEGRARVQQKVDTTYATFLSDVAAGRGLPVDAVRRGYGEGDVVMSADALRLGMVDRVATLTDTIVRALTAPATIPRVRQSAHALTALQPFRDQLARATLTTHRRELAALGARVLGHS